MARAFHDPQVQREPDVTVAAYVLLTDPIIRCEHCGGAFMVDGDRYRHQCITDVAMICIDDALDADKWHEVLVKWGR